MLRKEIWFPVVAAVVAVLGLLAAAQHTFADPMADVPLIDTTGDPITAADGTVVDAADASFIAANQPLAPLFSGQGNYCIAFGDATFNYPAGEEPPDLLLTVLRELEDRDPDAPATVEKAYLFWSGRASTAQGNNPAGDSTLTVDVNGVKEPILASQSHIVDSPSALRWFTYAYEFELADAPTGAQLAKQPVFPLRVKIANDLAIEEPHGVGLLVLYRDPVNCPYKQVDLLYGNDVIFKNWTDAVTGLKGLSSAQCVELPRLRQATEIDVQMFVGGVANRKRSNNLYLMSASEYLPPGTAFSALEPPIDPLRQPLEPLNGYSEAQFDNYDTLVRDKGAFVAAPGMATVNRQWACVQLESPQVPNTDDNGVTLEQGVSATWISLAVRTPLASIQISPSRAVKGLDETHEFILQVESAFDLDALTITPTLLPASARFVSTCSPESIVPGVGNCTVQISSTQELIYTLTAQADITFSDGITTNVSTDNTGNNSGPAVVSFIPLPSAEIQLQKLTACRDADTGPGPIYAVGAPVTWSYVVTNRGEETLHAIAVSDDQGVDVTCPATSLTMGESMVCTGTGVAVAGPYANLGLVTAESINAPGEPISASDASHYTGVPVGGGLDWGDAPASYGTLEGPNHLFAGALYLGAWLDFEARGFPSPMADGDDLDPPGAQDDEDGLITGLTLTAGEIPQLTLSATNLSDEPATLYGWLDLNSNGRFDVDERVETLVPPQSCDTTVVLLFDRVPLDYAANGGPLLAARFRISADSAAASPTAPAMGGEVEDYAFSVVPSQLDWGDAPASYGTTKAADGPRHRVVPGLRLGAIVDVEAGGLPTADADGDDLNSPADLDDEDGLVSAAITVTDGVAVVPLTATNLTDTPATLFGWLDANQNGLFEPAEQAEAPVPAQSLDAPVFVQFDQLAGALDGATVARFRLSTDPAAASPLGPALDGEVEDHRVTLQLAGGPEPAADWGDAPDSYATLRASDGPRHNVVPGLHMGALVDAEDNGMPGPGADGDDTTPNVGPDDEDGSAAPLRLQIYEWSAVTVTVTNQLSVSATLYGWIDFNGQNGFADDMVVMRPVPPGAVDLPVVLEFGAPLAQAASHTYARFRLSTDPAAAMPTGAAADGEVEDHPVVIDPLDRFDWGDAPDRYRTRIIDDGPRHLVIPQLFLGGPPDTEADGQPTAAADGDDFNPADGAHDEDGYGLPTMRFDEGDPMVVEFQAANRVNRDAMLYGWLDSNGNNRFDAEERQEVRVEAGTVNVTATLDFGIAATQEITRPVTTYARFRFSSDPAAALPYGIASDGEVEDYSVTIYPAHTLELTVLAEGLVAGTWATLQAAVRTRSGEPAAKVPVIFQVVGLNNGISRREFTNQDGMVTFRYRYRSACNGGTTVGCPGAALTDLVSAWIDYTGDSTSTDSVSTSSISVSWTPIKLDVYADAERQVAVTVMKNAGDDNAPQADVRLRFQGVRRDVILTTEDIGVESEARSMFFATQADLAPPIIGPLTGFCDLAIIDSDDPLVDKIVIWADLDGNGRRNGEEPSCIGEIATGDAGPSLDGEDEHPQQLFLPLVQR